MDFDKTDMEMIRRGDMLGPTLGAKVATALETLQRERDEAREALRALFSLCEAGGDPFDEPGRPTVLRKRRRAALTKGE